MLSQLATLRVQLSKVSWWITNIFWQWGEILMEQLCKFGNLHSPGLIGKPIHSILPMATLTNPSSTVPQFSHQWVHYDSMSSLWMLVHWVHDDPHDRHLFPSLMQYLHIFSPHNPFTSSKELHHHFGLNIFYFIYFTENGLSKGNPLPWQLIKCC